MLVILAGIFLVHVLSLILLLVATIDNAWWVTKIVSTDLWRQCVLVNGVYNCTAIPQSAPQESLHVVQALSILACIFCFLSLIVFIAQLFTLPKGLSSHSPGVFQLLSGLCIMIAASIYTNQFHTSDTSGWYGHSFILAWTAFALTFISTVIYFVLRKKTQ
ncbi:epithelial membrane protein 1 [Polyodon spathula]|uniref:epithelial membrane protein 1 n=1 Tax=Polyodon spathula TaxID=7913 RepID=UPI001B7E807F|nr:epithelial membrane protein 1 [Polyodon spathula]